MLGPNRGEIELAAILSWDVTFRQRMIHSINEVSTNFDQRGEIDSVAIVVTRWPNSCDVRALERRVVRKVGPGLR
jgi:hypothetical protein